MKIKNLLFTLLAVGLCAACSDDGELATNGSGEENTGTAYLSLKVALPTSTTPGTRVGEGNSNDQFSDGTQDEYDVKDLTVILFDTDGKTSIATVSKVYSTLNGSISLPDFSLNGTANVTTNANLGVMQVASIADCYALIIANNNGKLPSITEGTTTYDQINTAFSGTKGSEFNNSGFFMSNSPIVENNAVTTLVKCTPKETPAEATNVASTVYLERILGKVEVKSNAANNSNWSGWTYTVPTPTTGTNTHTGDIIALTNWGLDITNTMAYPVRLIDESATTSWLDDNYWLMNGVNRFYGTAAGPIRLYYAIDPNYTSSDVANRVFDKTDCTKSLTSGTKPTIDYCLENTFDVTNQKQGQTTRMIVQSNYKFGSGTANTNFYRTDTYNYLTQTALENRIVEELVKATGNSNITSITEFKFYTKDYVNPNPSAHYVDKSLKRAKLGEITYTPTGATSATIVKLGDGSGIVEAVNKNIGRLDYFKDGICYYVARIKHFGDALTLWNNTDNYTDGSTAYADNLYLGRYGIVRNNWYQLTLNSIDNGPGEPIIPTIPGVDPASPDEPVPGQPTDPTDPTSPTVPTDPSDPTPNPSNPEPDNQDDELKYYIDCKINILSWAKRSQTIDW